MVVPKNSMTFTVEPEALVITPEKAEDLVENEESVAVPIVETAPVESVVVLRVSVVV